MMVHLSIDPGLEAQLIARASAAGMSLERFIEDLLEREAGGGAPSGSVHPLTASEKAKAFRAWATSFPPDLPVLSLQDVSREKIYD